MFLLYDFVFLIFSLIYLPVYLFRRRFHRGFVMRLGIYPDKAEFSSPIWLHAVSVGEAMIMKTFASELRKAYPKTQLVISTVTPTGNKIACDIAEKNDYVTYLPLDFSCVVKKTIDKINPRIFIIAETEIWPNLITYLHYKQIPVAVINGRFSDRSFKGYSLIKFLMKTVLRKVDLFCVQSTRDLQRLLSLGVSPGRIKVTGNMKFDSAITRDSSGNRNASRQSLGLKETELLLVAGSTHSAEEDIIFGAYNRLKKEFPELRLLLAPRHPERTPEIENLAKRYNINTLRLSSISQNNLKTGQYDTVFLLDIIGQMVFYYSAADIVFVGGSLVRKGGHNILEPAYLEKPILFGQFMFNFKDIAELFVENKAAIQLKKADDLGKEISFLLKEPSRMAKLGSQAKKLTLQNIGATDRNLNLIKEVYPKNENIR